MAVEVPSDVYVVSIAAEGPVQAGDVLVELRSPALEREASALEAMVQHIDIIARPPRDGRVDAEIATVSAKADALDEAVTLNDQLLQVANSAFNAGEASHADVVRASVSLVRAKSAAADARLAFSQAQSRKSDLLDKVTTATNKLARDRAFVDEMAAFLVVRSPVAGTFAAMTGAGLYLRKGQRAGEVTT